MSLCFGSLGLLIPFINKGHEKTHFKMKFWPFCDIPYTYQDRHLFDRLCINQIGISNETTHPFSFPIIPSVNLPYFFRPLKELWLKKCGRFTEGIIGKLNRWVVSFEIPIWLMHNLSNRRLSWRLGIDFLNFFKGMKIQISNLNFTFSESTHPCKDI